MADDAGALMVRAGLIASHHLAAARALQASDGGTVGEQLVAIGAVSDEALTEFYRSRLMVPQINPNTLARLGTAVVAVLPGDMAVEFRAVPVSLDKDDNLTVAMSDPSDRHAVDEIAFFTGKYVVRAVATQMQIAWCLAQYYGHVTELGERLLQPVSEAPAIPAPPPRPSPAPAAVPAAPTLPRQRGDTARVEASRHRVLAPVTTPPPVGPRPGPESLSRPPTPPTTEAPPAAPVAAAAASGSGPITIEMQIDDPSGPVRMPSEMPVAVLERPAPSAEPSATAKPATDPSATPTIIVSPEATQPKRKRPALPDPPELAARSGEMEAHETGHGFDAPSSTVEIHLEDAEPPAPIRNQPPPVVIEDADGAAPARPVSDDDTRAATDDTRRAATDDDAPAVIHDRDGDAAYIHDEGNDHEPGDDVGTESQPILLDRPRRGSQQDAVAPPQPAPAPEAAPADDSAAAVISSPVPQESTDEPSGPILLVARKRGGRREKRTQIGIGALGALGPIPASPGANPTPSPLAPAVARAAAAAAPQADSDRDAVPAAVPEDEEAKTRRVDARPAAAVDDGWGPPGTTIPPPFLGAVVPADDPASGRIPLPGEEGDSAQLVLSTPTPTPTPPAAPTSSATAPTAPHATPGLGARRRLSSGGPDAAEHARALEEAAIKLVEALRGFDQATSRDHAIAMLVDFIGGSHHRVAFLAAKGGELSAFMQNPAPIGPPARLSLSAPSVFQDVVGTRLPYRGSISDPVSRELVRNLFGSTTDEMLAVPVAIRDRVVGVVYADGRQRLAFDEHVAVAARATGMALERLLKSKRQ